MLVEITATTIQQRRHKINFFDYIISKGVAFSRTPGGLIIINDTLDLSDSGVTHLPDSLIVMGSLILKGCAIDKLPGNLKVYDNLDAKNTKVRVLPIDMEIGRAIFLENTRIESLSDNFHCYDSLDLENTPIERLPKNLRVNGYLNIKGTLITELRDDLLIGGPLLVDLENLQNLVAWRSVETAALAFEAEHSQIPKSAVLLAQNSEIFSPIILAVWISRTIRISFMNFYGTMEQFVAIHDSEIIKATMFECVQELNEKIKE
ncbi:hypothetical protein [Acerihabitans sp.]|uniref:hypothetical protein n=1 Tax=Acerihabitans sp. TaxID=2811394 RepID=UPI002ED8824F